MRDAHKGLEKVQFVKPPNSLVVGKKVTVPDVLCRSLAEARDIITAADLDMAVADEKVDSLCAEGTVAKSDPVGGSTTSKGSSVVVYLSTGKAPPAPSPSPEPPSP
jgi:beta-lactam-binding protein with PASTA domain